MLLVPAINVVSDILIMVLFVTGADLVKYHNVLLVWPQVRTVPAAEDKRHTFT